MGYTEVNFLGIVEHTNLVKLLGYRAEDDKRGIQQHISNQFIYGIDHSAIVPGDTLQNHPIYFYWVNK